jgi:hypothetical protein
MTYFAVLDALSRAFVVDGQGQWLFNYRAEADAFRMVENEETGGVYLIAEFDEPPTTGHAALADVDIPDGPLMGESNGGEA